jgi:hypothetical protein
MERYVLGLRRMPELLEQIAPGRTIPIVEGEKERKRPMIGHVGDDGDIDEATADAAIGQTEKRASIRREKTGRVICRE